MEGTNLEVTKYTYNYTWKEITCAIFRYSKLKVVSLLAVTHNVTQRFSPHLGEALRDEPIKVLYILIIRVNYITFISRNIFLYSVMMPKARNKIQWLKASIESIYRFILKCYRRNTSNVYYGQKSSKFCRASPENVIIRKPLIREQYLTVNHTLVPNRTFSPNAAFM